MARVLRDSHAVQIAGKLQSFDCLIGSGRDRCGNAGLCYRRDPAAIRSSILAKPDDAYGMFNPEFLPSLPACIRRSGRSSRPGARSPEEAFRHMSSGDRRPRTGVQTRVLAVLPSTTIIPITGYDGTVALRPMHRKPRSAYGAC